MNEKINAYLKKIKDKKILIHGLGINGGGLGSALFFLENGFKVTITDLKLSDDLKKSLKELDKYENKITYVFGEHREKDFIENNLIVKSPAVKPDNKFIKIAENNGAYITSDIEIFYEICPCPLFAITGSKGKSTTVSAIHHIFEQQTDNAFIGGNITISPLTFYKQLNKDSLVILELSSWQLRDLKNKNYKFNISAITNLLNDHQNYYSSMNDYLSDKILITANQTKENFLIIPYNDKYINTNNFKTNAKVLTYSYDEKKSDLFFENDNAVLYLGQKIKLFDKNDLIIKGGHMALNMLLAAGFCCLSGIKPENIISGIKTFKGAPYRMELIREWHGIKFINDTTATIPDAVYNALLSFKKPVIWIGGGTDKNLDFQIIEKIYNIPKKIFLLKGDATDKMLKYIKRDDVTVSDSLERILEEAIKIANNNDIILLSPGCASFGLFQNEFHRGDVFNNFVKSLKD